MGILAPPDRAGTRCAWCCAKCSVLREALGCFRWHGRRPRSEACDAIARGERSRSLSGPSERVLTEGCGRGNDAWS